MKLNRSHIQTAYDRLATNPDLSLRSLAKELGVTPSTLHYRMSREFGPCFLANLRGQEGCLLHVLRKEILLTLTESERSEVEEWIKQNIAALVVDNNLMTASQEDRLTRAECCRDYPLDELLTYSSYLNDRLEAGYQLLYGQQYQYIQVDPESSFIPTSASSVSSTSYINLEDLQAVLVAFYAGSLNDCDHLLDRIYRPLSQLNPVNSLWSLIDEATLQDCLSQLSQEQQVVLRYQFSSAPLELEASFYSHFHQSHHVDLNSYQSTILIEALTLLSDLLLKVI
jgi:hypothetical protein